MGYTVHGLIQAVYDQFNSAPLVYGHGTDNAWDESVALVLGVTDVADEQSRLDEHVDDSDAERTLALAQQRVLTRQPLPYLLGHCRFMGYPFLVRPGVIVPRSPIGSLLERSLDPWLPGEVLSVLDLCAGSGCLGILAAHRFQRANITLVDVDESACALAHDNIVLHELESRVRIVQCDVIDCVAILDQQFDLVLANPPYVNAVDMRSLPAEFRAEPDLALAAGNDGLKILHQIITALPRLLKSSGVMVGEVGRSTQAFQQAYPELPVVWLDLPAGGEGVFLLEGDALTSHTAPT